jgi:hypothetical protein
MSFKDKIKNIQKNNRLSGHKPSLISTNPDSVRRSIAESVLPEGAVLDDRMIKKSNFWGGSYGFNSPGGSSFYHLQRPYQPDFDSPDRQWYPEDLKEANKFWRLFYKSDPMFGTAVELYSTMMTSDFDITLENEQDSTIRNTLLDMCEKVQLQSVIQNMCKEYLVVGEAIPHCFFNSELGIWDYVNFHNPDFIEVIDPPMVKFDPLIYFVPDDDLRDFLNSTDPEIYEVKKRLPNEFISKVLSRQKIQLSSLNCSFIARKLHPYEARGTSLASRIWRINVVEDAVYNSTIALYRRSAAPLKVLKLGSEASGWIPSPEMEQRLLSLVTQAEIDPAAWITTNFGVNFETWGNTDRGVTISKEHSVIENVKLNALGLSKSFLSGEVSYASAKSGLQVFLRRLLSMRQFFESVWLYPKFFRPIIDIQDWQTSSTAEVAHRIKIKRKASEAEEQGRIIKPKIIWKNKLDSNVDDDMLKALQTIKNMGFDVSLQTIGSTVGLDWVDETKKMAHEFLEKGEVLSETLGETKKLEFEQSRSQQTKPAGAPGSGAPPTGSGKAPPGKKPPSTPPGNSDNPGKPSNEPIESPGSDMVGD